MKKAIILSMQNKDELEKLSSDTDELVGELVDLFIYGSLDKVDIKTLEAIFRKIRKNVQLYKKMKG